jgi:alpha-amylase
LKRDNPLLANGIAGAGIEFLLTGADSQIVAYARRQGERTLVVVVNLSDRECVMSLSGEQISGHFTNPFSPTEPAAIIPRKMTLSPWEYRVYLR